MSRSERFAVIGGAVVALLLMAPLVTTLVWGEDVGTTPGFFVLGIALLVMCGGLVFDRSGDMRYLNRIVTGLIATAVVLIALDLTQVI